MARGSRCRRCAPGATIYRHSLISLFVVAVWRRWVVGVAMAILCVGLLCLDMNVLMPHFRGEPYPHLVKRYAYLGHTLPEVLASVVVRPWRWMPVVFTPEKAFHLLALLAPLGLLPLAAPGAAAAALPGLAVNLLSP